MSDTTTKEDASNLIDYLRRASHELHRARNSLNDLHRSAHYAREAIYHITRSREMQQDVLDKLAEFEVKAFGCK